MVLAYALTTAASGLLWPEEVVQGQCWSGPATWALGPKVYLMFRYWAPQDSPPTAIG